MTDGAPKPRRRWTAEERRTIRAYDLITAFDADDTVTVDGVKLRFACEVDRSKWRPAYALGLYGHAAALHGPEIIFPWTPRDWRKALEKEGHAIEAKRGSLVFVGYVISAPIPTPFEGLEDPDQTERKLAYLCVMDSGGNVEVARRPFLLLPLGAIAAHIQMGDPAAAFRGMISKLERVLGYEDLEAMVDEPTETWPKPRVEASRAYRQAAIALAEASKELDEKGYAIFGYQMARAEAEEWLLEPAKRGALWSDTTRRATTARRDRSRARSDALRQYAQTLIKAEPNISLSRCAKLVADAFEKDARTVSRQIIELFEKRRDGRGYRPKRPPS